LQQIEVTAANGAARQYSCHAMPGEARLENQTGQRRSGATGWTGDVEPAATLLRAGITFEAYLQNLGTISGGIK
jgi:hypothetical protein